MKKPSHGPSDDDIFKAYMNRGGNSAGYKWNEHQYFIKAMEDLHRNQQDRMAKVSQVLCSPATAVDLLNFLNKLSLVSVFVC